MARLMGQLEDEGCGFWSSNFVRDHIEGVFEVLRGGCP